MDEPEEPLELLTEGLLTPGELAEPPVVGRVTITLVSGGGADAVEVELRRGGSLTEVFETAVGAAARRLVEMGRPAPDLSPASICGPGAPPLGSDPDEVEVEDVWQYISTERPGRERHLWVGRGSVRRMRDAIRLAYPIGLPDFIPYAVRRALVTVTGWQTMPDVGARLAVEVHEALRHLADATTGVPVPALPRWIEIEPPDHRTWRWRCRACPPVLNRGWGPYTTRDRTLLGAREHVAEYHGEPVPATGQTITLLAEGGPLDGQHFGYRFDPGGEMVPVPAPYIPGAGGLYRFDRAEERDGQPFWIYKPAGGTQ